ncbi:YhcN/YlaJ family sporulation lipoprotein [Cohnella fermenti]|uniref:YhcN/YlaJ family sporulation lipoprotein n=1 Tax=Cohnella fermenti TaxID=2565925 RepID=A0A4S4BLY1_9BACL|nr:YhcN/YlaJ family sporulation lipoprotein [Cohnella fermenti]THF73373.1 hypothetical protein E6C55_29655 [Cohnella fermenti]
MKKSLVFSTLVLSTALAVTGCATKQGEMSTKNVKSNAYRMKFAHDGARESNRYHGMQKTGDNIVGLDGQSHVEMSQEIADRLAALPEIKSAHVGLTNNNAYVAVVQERNRSGKVTAHSTRTHTVTPYSTRSLSGVDRGVGPNNPNSTTDTYSPKYSRSYGTGTAGTNYGTGTTGTHYGTRTPGMMGTTGTIGTTGTTGTTYGTGTAGTVPSEELSDALKNQVADIVKGMNPNIDNVYVSSNADLYGRMESYANDVRAGHPVKGFMEEFSALVSRIFPQEAGSGTKPLSVVPHTPNTNTYSSNSSYYAPTKVAPSYHAPTGR